MVANAAATTGCPAEVSGPSVTDFSTPLDGRDPGRVVARRLNRSEYNNTVRDLLGTRLRPADDFPADDLGYGFDNIAAVLSLSPLHIETYERAATLLARDALRAPITEPVDLRVEAEDVAAEVEPSLGSAYRGTAWDIYNEGAIEGAVTVPYDGLYRFEVKAFAGPLVKGEAPTLVLELDGKEITSFEVINTEPEALGVEVTLTEGEHSVAARFINPFYDAQTSELRRVVIDWIGVNGPLDAPAADEWPRTRLVTCDPVVVGKDACAREVLQEVTPRAWRRPVTDDEMSGLMDLAQMVWDEGLGFDAGLELALRAVLTAPQFVFKLERDPTPSGLEPRLLDGWEVAVRLSYFIWSSLPDAELRRAAAAGELGTPAGIEAQVERMLDDPKAAALVDEFFGQWLYIRDVANAFPDKGAFPDFDEPLREAMASEMLLFAQTFVTEDRSLSELLTAQETFVNARLASHYGISGIEGEAFRRISTEGVERRGLLGQAGLLTVLSTPFRTSVVRRGKWVLEQLMCAPPPPPPPGVEGLVENEESIGEGQTLRDILEQHRADPVCATCHVLMDPIGFGLENYDGIGKWRTEDNGVAVDASGELIDGTAFVGAVEMAEILAEDPRFYACAAEKLFIYALGRGETPDDAPILEEITDAFEASGHRFRKLVALVATSDAFRFRRPADLSQEDSP